MTFRVEGTSHLGKGRCFHPLPDFGKGDMKLACTCHAAKRKEGMLAVPEFLIARVIDIKDQRSGRDDKMLASR
jgi:hypothetical protein